VVNLEDGDQFFSSYDDYLKHVEKRKRLAQANTEKKRAINEIHKGCLAVVQILERYPKLEAAKLSLWHKFVEAVQNKRAFTLVEATDLEGVFDLGMALSAKPFVFVVNHDWAKGFDKSDVLGAEWRLPADDCVFEYQLFGHRVILHWTADRGAPQSCAVYVRCTSEVWYYAFKATYEDGKLVTDKRMVEWGKQQAGGGADMPWEDLPKYVEVCFEQVRAVCIMLGAEVATTHVVRAPAKLNYSREKKGKLPLMDYHVVELNRRKRYDPVPLEMRDDGPKTRKRFHWVRGHHRQLKNMRIWIEWHVRGDPDLGIIEKEYRL
jgi:hypothetical protein